MFRFFMFAALALLSASSMSFADSVCCPAPEDSLITDQLVVKRGVYSGFEDSAFALCLQTFRQTTFDTTSLGQKTKVIDRRWTPLFQELLNVESGITEEQANLAINSPGKIIPVKDAKEKFGGRGWLFKKARGIIFKNPAAPHPNAMKSVSFTDSLNSSPSWEIIFPATLIMFFAFIIGLIFGALKNRRSLDHLGKITNIISAFSFFSLLFCLCMELLMLSNIAEQKLLFSVFIINAFMMALLLTPSFCKHYYRSLNYPVWTLLQLCGLIGFLAGLYAFIFYLGAAIATFTITLLLLFITRRFSELRKKRPRKTSQPAPAESVPNNGKK
jgi:hypothetical protein